MPVSSNRMGGKTKRVPRKKKDGFSLRKRVCRFCVNKIKFIDYKDAKMLEAFVKERGKIVSSRISGNCAKHQRALAEAIKQARHMSIIPYIK